MNTRKKGFYLRQCLVGAREMISTVQQHVAQQQASEHIVRNIMEDEITTPAA